GLCIPLWCLRQLISHRLTRSDIGRYLAMLGIVFLAGFAVLLNPYGADLPRTWLSLTQSTVLPQIIQEHAPLNPLRSDGLNVLVFALLYLVVLAGIHPQQARVVWFLPLPWLWQACAHIRHAPLFALAAVLAIADMLPHTRWAEWMARSRSDLFQM